MAVNNSLPLPPQTHLGHEDIDRHRRRGHGVGNAIVVYVLGSAWMGQSRIRYKYCLCHYWFMHTGLYLGQVAQISRPSWIRSTTQHAKRQQIQAVPVALVSPYHFEQKAPCLLSCPSGLLRSRLPTVEHRPLPTLPHPFRGFDMSATESRFIFFFQHLSLLITLLSRLVIFLLFLSLFFIVTFVVDVRIVDIFSTTFVTTSKHFLLPFTIFGFIQEFSLSCHLMVHQIFDIRIPIIIVSSDTITIAVTGFILGSSLPLMHASVLGALDVNHHLFTVPRPFSGW
ncbi:hypothetical protein BKA70DRAFT_833664 [Coprinopsis sp. MPI-PUGE-AT-0042]|nr:hypothetical protein BKA70DRAFT_833664 [Coprinopsis sp. MPI-PUGE-AT-0042]